MEKIIDFEKNGNVVRFYIGTSDDYWGDDWNDCPYEHNAGTVYSAYVTRIIDVAFPFDAKVLEPADDYPAWQGNSPYTKEDMKKRNTPCLIVVPEEIALNDWVYDSFTKYVGSDNVERFYFNDPVKKIQNCEIATVLKNERKEG